MELLSRGERLLLQCLNANRCVLAADEEAEELKATVRALPGMRMLRRKPRCLFQNKKSCPRSSGNRETGAEVDTAAQAAKNRAVAKGRIYRLQTRRDIAFNAYDSCAVVGNGPGLARDQVGGLIDQYDVVLRMNHVNYRAPERRYASATGKKTTHRVFSKMASYLLAEGKIRIPGRAGEKWLFWHDRSRHAIAALSNKSGFQADLLMFSPVSCALSREGALREGLTHHFLTQDHINKQLGAYFQLRVDLRRLGVGPFSCPYNMNSGMHAVMAVQYMCKRVGIFGLSISERLARGGGHFGNKGHIMSAKHAWDVDTKIIKLFHLQESASVCTH